MSLLTFLILKNSHSQYGIYYIFLKKRLAINLKGFQNQIGNSVEIMKKQLSSKPKFRESLQTFCSNLRLKPCQRPYSYKRLPCRQNLQGSVVSSNKKLYPEIIIHKIFQTNSSYHVKQRTIGKVQFLFFRRFLLVLTNYSFQEEA